MDSGTPAHGPPRDRLRRLESQFIRPYRLSILLALAGMLVQSLLLLPIPLTQGWAVDGLVALGDARAAGSDAAGAEAGRGVLLALGVALGCLAVRTVLAWKVGAVMTWVSLEVVRDLTDALHRKLQRLPMAYFDREQTGGVMARITSDVGSLLIFLGTGSLQLASDLVLAAGVIGVLFWLDTRLAVVACIALPLYALNHHLFARRLRALSESARARLGAVYSLLSERVSAVRVVRSYGQEEREATAFAGRLDRHLDAGLAGARAVAWQSAVATLVGGLGTVGVLAGGAVLVGRGSLSVGELLAFYTLVALLYNPLVRLTQFQGTWAATRVAADRMMEVLDEPEAVTDRPDARPLPAAAGAVDLRDVSFRYRPDGPLVLDRVSLSAAPGTRVGILGASGSGKSTLLALLPRLYDVPEGAGALRLDGHDVRDLRLADLRRAVALVPQQAVLFDGTIRSNLTYAAPEATEADLERVLEAVDLDRLVAALPQGLETPVGERGHALSGGQRQRLALARTLLAEPAVLLLDDCTSALDAETEARIQSALEELLPGRTWVVVSHKVSSVRRADRILVLDRGRVAEEGTHEELLAKGGLYAETFRLQTAAPPSEAGLSAGTAFAPG